MPEQNVIPLEIAQEWAARWRNNPSPEVYAFLIPEIDITQVMAERETVNVRSYLGIDENNAYKLMIVGVDANGNDLINDEAGQYIYDFTSGCPKICDLESPLFKF